MKSDRKKFTLIDRYQIAIKAREKLTDDYHKWMTFYYVATSAVLIAITNLHSKEPDKIGIFFLSLLGLLISMFWNLSCKGYCYWSKSWIQIIIRLEKKIIGKKIKSGVYSIFSKKVAKKGDSVLKPNGSANISTPKLSLLFSFTAILSWLLFIIYQYINLDFFKNICDKKIILIVFVIVFLVFYLVLLPIWTISRKKGEHKLV